MKRILVIILICLWIFFNKGTAQISIHPEVGLSYLPFNLLTTFFLEKPRKLDPVFGITAQMPIHPLWYVKSRISYSKRGDKVYSGVYIFSTINEYVQRDLNIEFSINYQVNNFIDFSVGTSLYQTFAHYKISTLDEPIETNYYNMDQFFLAINTGLSFGFERFKLHMIYMKLFRESDFYIFSLGKNRFDLTVSYHLLGGDKGKKRGK